MFESTVFNRTFHFTSKYIFLIFKKILLKKRKTNKKQMEERAMRLSCKLSLSSTPFSKKTDRLGSLHLLEAHFFCLLCQLQSSLQSSSLGQDEVYLSTAHVLVCLPIHHTLAWSLLIAFCSFVHRLKKTMESLKGSLGKVNWFRWPSVCAVNKCWE